MFRSFGTLSWGSDEPSKVLSCQPIKLNVLSQELLEVAGVALHPLDGSRRFSLGLSDDPVGGNSVGKSGDHGSNGRPMSSPGQRCKDKSRGSLVISWGNGGRYRTRTCDLRVMSPIPMKSRPPAPLAYPPRDLTSRQQGIKKAAQSWVPDPRPSRVAGSRRTAAQALASVPNGKGRWDQTPIRRK